MTPTITHTLGIDIAKAKFDVALHRARAAPPPCVLNKYHLKDKSATFTNDASGFEALLTWLAKHDASLDCIHVAMEATGVYYEALAIFLCAKDIKTSVVNPALISGYAKASLSRTKTDKADAKLIASYCDALQPALWLAPAPCVRRLRELTRRLVDLKDLHQQESNRLSQAHLTHDSITVVMDALGTQIKLITKAIKTHIGQHPELKAQAALLDTIPGMGGSPSALCWRKLSLTALSVHRSWLRLLVWCQGYGSLGLRFGGGAPCLKRAPRTYGAAFICLRWWQCSTILSLKRSIRVC